MNSCGSNPRPAQTGLLDKWGTTKQDKTRLTGGMPGGLLPDDIREPDALDVPQHSPRFIGGWTPLSHWTLKEPKYVRSHFD